MTKETRRYFMWIGLFAGPALYSYWMSPQPTPLILLSIASGFLLSPLARFVGGRRMRPRERWHRV